MSSGPGRRPGRERSRNNGRSGACKKRLTGRARLPCTGLSRERRAPWASSHGLSMRCEMLPSLEEPFVVGSSSLDPLLEMASWLVRLRMVNECFILNSTNLAAIFAKKCPRTIRTSRDALPAWTLFYTVAGYEYFPEERVSSYIKDITDLTQRLGVEAVKAAGGISANEILKAVQKPSAEPYWKLRYKGACQDIFFLTINDKLEGQISSHEGPGR